MKSNSTFTRASAGGLSVSEIRISGNGVLVVRNTSTYFSGDLIVESPRGDFEFFDNGTFTLSGKASRIEMPGSGIKID